MKPFIAMFLSLCLSHVAQAADEPAAKADATATIEPRVDTSAAARSATMDRLELDATSITGNQELPKVLYIVPWKKPLAGELPDRPASTLLDEVLAPVDREVFRRHVSYFEALDETNEQTAAE